MIRQTCTPSRKLLAVHRPGDLLDARVLVSRRWPSSSAAARLHNDAGKAWPTYRDEVIDTLAATPRDAAQFALLALNGVRFRWDLAHSHTLESNDVWERLTKEYEKLDPLAVLPILTRLVEGDLTEAVAQRYRNAARPAAVDHGYSKTSTAPVSPERLLVAGTL